VIIFGDNFWYAVLKIIFIQVLALAGDGLGVVSFFENQLSRFYMGLGVF
jgi:hypothetical protein